MNLKRKVQAKNVFVGDVLFHEASDQVGVCDYIAWDIQDEGEEAGLVEDEICVRWLFSAGDRGIGILCSSCFPSSCCFVFPPGDFFKFFVHLLFHMFL